MTDPHSNGPSSAIAARIESAVERLRDELVAELSAALRTPSVNPRYPGEDYEARLGGESDVSRLVAAIHARAGCDVDVFAAEPGRENAVGVLRGAGGGRSLLFNGHVDVVPPGPLDEWTGGDPWSGAIRDGRAHGRGATDMKAGVIAQAFAALALREADVRLAGDLILTAVVGEETMEHELGTTACVRRGYTADAAVVGEASAPPAALAVIPATPGVTRFIVRIRGRRTHPGLRSATIWPGGGGPAVGVNAIDKAVLIYDALRRLEHDWGLTHQRDLFAPGQFGVQPGVFVGSPRGQLDPFFIPDEAMLDYVVIYPPDAEIEAVRAEIEAQVASAARLDAWLREHPPTVEWKHHWPPSVVAADHPIVEALAAAHEVATGEPARRAGWTAAHDGTFLNAAGIPAACYGPGDLRLAHAPDESVDLDEVLTATRAYALLAAGWCGVTNGGTGSRR
jgi:acetylornithine deacetylase/succinyl-diaminopimelate desuccinylase family protein